MRQNNLKFKYECITKTLKLSIDLLTKEDSSPDLSSWFASDSFEFTAEGCSSNCVSPTATLHADCSSLLSLLKDESK